MKRQCSLRKDLPNLSSLLICMDLLITLGSKDSLSVD